MTREQVQTLLRHHKDALNRHDVAALMAMYAESAVVASPMFRTVSGRAAIEDSFRSLFALWPDYQVRVNDDLFICQEDRAAEFGIVTATHSAELFGLRPTGERIEYGFARLYTFLGTQIVAERRIYDLRGVIERLDRSQLDVELQVAGTIQRLLLPRTHHSGASFEVVGASMPSRTIGGDFFEYVDLPSGGLGVGIGDVSGKGPAAALIAAMVQGILSVEAEAERPPAITLGRLNQALRRRDIEPVFVTLFHGILSPDGRFCYSNSGHNPPILLTTAGVQRLTTGGPMLGPFEHPTFDEETLRLDPGDTIVMFSDGVTEATNPSGDFFTDAALVECVSRRRQAPLQDILDGVLECVRRFGGTAIPSDDVTIVVLRARS